MTLPAPAAFSRWIWHLLAVLFLAATLYQLHLPGLHYDEAKEAGVNALQLVHGHPVQAFRGAAWQIGELALPLMVQDYIGALNVYLAAPLFTIFDASVWTLRGLSLLIGVGTLWLTYLAGRDIVGRRAGWLATALLVVSPSFVFWQRQGIFVTNITGLLAVLALWCAWRWTRRRRARDLYGLAAAIGLGLYAKLLFVWVVGALALAWLFLVLPRARHDITENWREFPWQHAVGGVVLFLITLLPLLWFNLSTSGTLQSIFSNLGTSYYGVDNRDYFINLFQRLQQVGTVLRGDHFWYLGGIFSNPVAPWLAAGLTGAAAVILRLRGTAGKRRRWALLLILPLGIVAQSAFTVSDLFVTHFLILLPFLALSVAASLEICRRHAPGGRWLVVLALIVWLAFDLRAVAGYHHALERSGGLDAHSDVTYAIADELVERGGAQPLALDWGLEAPLYFLSRGQVRPIEVFGYERLDAPDGGFAARVGPFLDDPNTIYLARAPETTIFAGRREALAELAAERGLTLHEEKVFRERSGRPLYVLLRVVQ